MQMSQYHYLPLAPGFFAILVGIFFAGAGAALAALRL